MQHYDAGVAATKNSDNTQGENYEDENPANPENSANPVGVSLLSFGQLKKRMWAFDGILSIIMLLMIFTTAKIVLFHLVFFVLTLGAFFWNLRSFIVHTAIWLSITTTVVIISVLNHQLHSEELIEIPLLSAILCLVFAIAQQRSRAEIELRAINDQLERRVKSRTDELTTVNNELLNEISERKRIARDLHDSLGQRLGYLHLRLAELAQTPNPSEFFDSQAELGEMQEVANEAYEQVREVIAGSLPANATKITVAVEELAKTFDQQNKFSVHFTTCGEPSPLSAISQQQVVYCCREALTNVAKHSGATTVTVNLAWAERNLTITISDDGCGFDVDSTQSEDSFGLQIMAERISRLGGKYAISSVFQEGTEVTFEIPLRN